MKSHFAALTVAAAVAAVAVPGVAAPAAPKPTIVLVHGAFADASSWNGVIAILQRDGYHVVAPPNTLRGPKNDGASVHALLATIPGPVVLVGHSYGGMVISNAGVGAANVRALVYVDAFTPDTGDTVGALNDKFPGSMVGPSLAPPVPLPGGMHDLYIAQDKYHSAFAPDMSAADARIAAAEQRPITDAAFGEKAEAPAWKTIPAYFVYGDHDTIIMPKLLAFMAERAHGREVKIVPGGSHVTMVTHPADVAKVIEDAATAAH